MKWVNCQFKFPKSAPVFAYVTAFVTLPDPGYIADNYQIL
jgi:hypothetical protein